MHKAKWVLGLVDTIYIHFVLGLATAMLMIKWTWLDMRSNAGAAILALVIITTFIYLINSKVKFYQSIYWQNRAASILVLMSGIVILATNSFKWEHLLIVPAYTVRAGFFLKNVSLQQVNLWIVIGLVIGTVCHILYRRIEIAEIDKRIVINRNIKYLVFAIIHSLFIVFTVYLVQPGVRYFINNLIRF